MFNSINNSFQYNVNAVSGTLRKSHPKSKFCVRDVDSRTYTFDSTKPRLYLEHYEPEIVILQVMLTGENKCLIEYVLKSDFQIEEGVSES